MGGPPHPCRGLVGISRMAEAAESIGGAAPRVLLCGASGFVGLATVRAFVRAGKAEHLTATVRSAVRAAEVVEAGAIHVRVLRESAQLASIAPEYHVVINAARVPTTGGGGRYDGELKMVQEVVSALTAAARSDGIPRAFAHLSGALTVGSTHGKDGKDASEFTGWADLEANPRHAVEQAVVGGQSDEQPALLRTALVRPSLVYGADSRSDHMISVHPRSMRTAKPRLERQGEGSGRTDRQDRQTDGRADVHTDRRQPHTEEQLAGHHTPPRLPPGASAPLA